MATETDLPTPADIESRRRIAELEAVASRWTAVARRDLASRRRIAELEAEVERLRATLERIHILAEDIDNRLVADYHQIAADARAALEGRPT